MSLLLLFNGVQVTAKSATDTALLGELRALAPQVRGLDQGAAQEQSQEAHGMARTDALTLSEALAQLLLRFGEPAWTFQELLAGVQLSGPQDAAIGGELAVLLNWLAALDAAAGQEHSRQALLPERQQRAVWERRFGVQPPASARNLRRERVRRVRLGRRA